MISSFKVVISRGEGGREGGRKRERGRGGGEREGQGERERGRGGGEREGQGERERGRGEEGKTEEDIGRVYTNNASLLLLWHASMRAGPRRNSEEIWEDERKGEEKERKANDDDDGDEW